MPLVLLHLSPFLRILGASVALRRWGALLNALAILAFLAMTALASVVETWRRRGEAPRR